MLHIILTILKIFGIIIACIIGLILLILLAILFIPIKYRSKGEFYKDKDLYVTVHWLFHLIYIRFHYYNGKQSMTIKVFGITIRRGKNRKKRFKKAKARKRQSLDTDQRSPDESDHSLLDNMPSSDIQKISTAENAVDINKEHMHKQTESKQDQKRKREKGFFHKIIDKVKEIFYKVMDFIKKLYLKIKSFFHKVKDFRLLIKTWYEYLTNEDNKTAIAFAKSSILALLKYIKPKKLIAKIRFGTGDPGTTGELLAILTIPYGFLYKNVIIQPDFENRVLEGDYYLKGRIRAYKVLYMLLVAYRHKELKAFIKNLPK